MRLVYKDNGLRPQSPEHPQQDNQQQLHPASRQQDQAKGQSAIPLHYRHLTIIPLPQTHTLPQSSTDNMHFSPAIAAAILAFSTFGTLAAPVPNLVGRQLAGEGAACDSVLSSTDNGVGYGVENAEDNTAATISGTGAKFIRRQLAGEGAACNSVLSSTDNGVGYGTENAEDGVASTVSSTGARRRQLDKISNGAQAVSQAAGTGASTSAATTELDNIDGESTSGAADAGAQIGNTEASTLEGAGKAVPKARRQLDKIANGAQAISNAAKTGSLTAPATNGLVGVDGTSTSTAAQLGAEAGDAEAGTLENAGAAVP